MVSQHKCRSMKRRIFAPPSLPAIVRPRPRRRSGHVTTDDESTEALHGSSGEAIVDIGQASLPAGHRMERFGRKEPLKQFRTAPAQRLLLTLIRTSTKAIQ